MSFWRDDEESKRTGVILWETVKAEITRKNARRAGRKWSACVGRHDHTARLEVADQAAEVLLGCAAEEPDESVDAFFFVSCNRRLASDDGWLGCSGGL